MNTYFYVDSIIKICIFLKLLQKSTLLVSYKLNRFWPPRVRTSLIFVHCYLEVTPGSYRYIKWHYIVNGDLTCSSSSISQLVLTFLTFCNGLLLQSFQLYYWNNSDSVFPPRVFILSPQCLKQYYFPFHGRKNLNELSCDVSL